MAFKMKGFGGFGNSPIKQITKTAFEGLAELLPKLKSIKYDVHGYPIGFRRVDPDGYVYTTDKYGNKIYTQKQDKIERQPERQPVRDKKNKPILPF